MPLVILADKPTGASDSETTIEVMGLLRGISRESHLTMAIVTHEPGVAEMRDCTVYIENGPIEGDDLTSNLPEEVFRRKGSHTMRIGHEYFSEIIDNFRRNRLRTFLTGFAVAWGIIFLVILLSIGMGPSRGISKSVNTGDAEPNYSIYFEAWTINLPYQGYPAGRWLYFDESQLAQLQEMIPAIEDIAPRLRSWDKISYVSQVVKGTVKSISTSYFGYFETRVRMLAGRGINGNDVRNREKTLPISSSDTLKFFGTDRYSEAIGKSVSIDNISSTVVGVYEASQNQSASYMPSNTFTMIRPSNQRIDGGYIYVPMVRSRRNFEAFNKKLLRAFSPIFSFSSDDDQMMWGYSNYVNNKQCNRVVNYFYLFLQIAGLSTLLIGIADVNNIMLITVRGRYKKIGIHKALGARPRDILAMIMVEGLFITAAAGAIDLVIAVGFAALGDYPVAAYHIGGISIMGETTYLLDTLVLSPQMAPDILVVMIIAGAVAGYTSACRATRISATEAVGDQRHPLT